MYVIDNALISAKQQSGAAESDILTKIYNEYNKALKAVTEIIVSVVILLCLSASVASMKPSI